MSDNYKINSQTIAIELPLESSEYLANFILENAVMRNKIRNDFVEEANKYKGQFNMYYEFSPLEFKTEYYKTIELPEDRYNKCCVGISEQVAEDFSISKKVIQTKNKKLLENAKKHGIDFNTIKFGEYKIKEFDNKRYTFRVKLKPSYRDNCLRLRLNIIDQYNAYFRVRSDRRGHDPEIIHLKFTQPIYDEIIYVGNEFLPTYIKNYESHECINRCCFSILDVKDICFKYYLGKYYAILFTDVSYAISKNSIKVNKGRIAGIDTGIRHPITIHDGKNTIYVKMDKKTVDKIHHLEERISRLNYYRNLKYEYNREHGLDTYSNNIKKLDLKTRKLYGKITNIKNHWAKNIAKQITTTYNMIVLDDYDLTNPDDNLPEIAKKRINYASRFHKMYYVNEFIKHDCIKYGCKYIPAPEDTTRTCSICKHVNPHLKISEEYLVCEKCGAKIERDKNAAQNCYDYAFDKLNE